MTEQPHILIVASPYYKEITTELVRGAVACVEEAGASWEEFTVPGVFEIPAVIAMAMRTLEFQGNQRRFDGYIALGCVIRGETTHYDYVCAESARALQGLAVDHCLALGYGIVTVENEEQARERAFVERRNKGGDAAAACLAMIGIKRQLNLFPR